MTTIRLEAGARYQLHGRLTEVTPPKPKVIFVPVPSPHRVFAIPMGILLGILTALAILGASPGGATQMCRNAVNAARASR